MNLYTDKYKKLIDLPGFKFVVLKYIYFLSPLSENSKNNNYTLFTIIFNTNKIELRKTLGNFFSLYIPRGRVLFNFSTKKYGLMVIV